MKDFIHQCVIKFSGIFIPQSILDYLLVVLLHLRGYNNYKNFQESGENNFLSNILAKHNPEICIDIGSNIGSYSNEILINTDADVISFEPLKTPFSKLRDLKKRWGDRLLIVNTGLGSTESNEIIYFDEDTTSHASLIQDVNNLSYVSNKNQEKISLTTLDIFLAKNPQQKSIDYIKVDTEGYEYDVLLGCKDTIKLERPKFIHIEFNWHQLIKSQTLYSFSLLLKGYNPYQVLPNSLIKRDPLDPISNIYSYSNFIFIREDISL